MKIKECLFILAMIIIDQISKYVISISCKLNQHIEVIKNFFYITYCRNDGAAFSILRGNRWLFVILTIVAVGLIIYYLAKSKAKSWEKLSYLLIISGAIGNLIDRVRFGLVTDFLDFYIFGYDFPVFNWADICVTIGVGLLLIVTLWGEKKNEAN